MKANGRPILLTHCGMLGDFIYSWPVASWIYRTSGRKIHWIIPGNFGPFRHVERLAMLQEFTHDVTLVGYKPDNYGCGGQPYKFDPNHWFSEEFQGDGTTREIRHEYYNLGFRHYPDKPLPAFIGEEHGFGWDPDWVLNLGDAARSADEPAGLPDLGTEHSNFDKSIQRIDLSRDILYNARWMARSERRHCWFSGMAAILYYARVPFLLYRVPGHPSEDLYFPDRSRYKTVRLPKAEPHPSFLK